MGMYTELHYNVQLRKDTPADVIETLRYMVGDYPGQEIDPPNHALFESSRWSHMLQQDSYYFDADTHSTMRWDNIAQRWYLCVRCNLKNYGSEIEHFIDWLDPYVCGQVGKFLGFHRYEESEEPVIIRKVRDGDYND